MQVASIGISYAITFKFTILKHLSRKSTPQGDNIIQNPNNFRTTEDQANAFLEHFKKMCDNPILVDLSYEKPDLNSPFTFLELATALKKYATYLNLC